MIALTTAATRHRHFCLFGILCVPFRDTCAGIKGWSVYCASGYCFVQSIDGGFVSDPYLNQYDGCPLGRITRGILHVLLKACPALAKHLDGSGVNIVMNNYSPTLGRCLASHDIVVVDTTRKKRTDVADRWLSSHAHENVPVTYFWRRVFDQKFRQAVSNAFFVCVTWAKEMEAKCAEKLAEVRDVSDSVGGAGSGRGAASGGGGGVSEEGREGGEDAHLSIAEVEEYVALLVKLRKVERVAWDERLSEHLMSMCNIGDADQGGRRTTPETRADSRGEWRRPTVGPTQTGLV